MLVESRYLVGLGLPRGGLLPHLEVTTLSVLAGLLLGTLIGIVTGLVSAFSNVIRQIIAPLAAFVGTLPLLVAAPFFLMWFGVSATARISLVAVYSALVVHTYAFRAVANMNPTLREYAATLGARPIYAFLHVVMPATMSEILGGLRVALGAAWGLVAITEILGSVTGVGRVIVATWGVYDITTMMAAILWLSLLALVLDGLVMLLMKWVLRWA
jgi:ABC-type nitrate/sulfonate/bicarbonate transport system permease component